MIQFSISSEDIDLLHELKNHPHQRIRQKAMVLILKNQDLPYHQISKTLRISRNTIRNYVKGYKNKGIDFVTAINAYRPQSDLVSFDDIVKKYLDDTPPASISQACLEISKLTGVTLKETQMRYHFKRLGAAHRKVAGIPAKVDLEKQRAFKENFLDPRLEEAIKGLRTVFFMDAAHFVLSAFLGHLWSIVRIFVRTPAGRQRFNVLGALNATTKELIRVTNDSYITSIQVCELLRLIRKTVSGPITIVLDNAKYQRCKLVIELAVVLDIELLFLPPYSPNLNLIERLWKFVKKNSLNSRYHGDFNIFRSAICSLLDTMNITHKKELDSLLTLNFQMYDEEKIKKAI